MKNTTLNVRISIEDRLELEKYIKEKKQEDKVILVKNAIRMGAMANVYKGVLMCNDNDIIIENGPIVSFLFNNKERKYYIDYYIPSENLIIEIKDNHIWHKEQVKIGLWSLKEKAAIKYAEENGLTYKLVFSQHLDEFLNSTFKI